MDLQFLKVLTGIATQGAISKETLKSYYVTTFKLEVSTNGEDWMMYRHGKNHKVSQAEKCFIFAPETRRLAVSEPEVPLVSTTTTRWRGNRERGRFTAES